MATTLTRWNPFKQMSRLEPFADIEDMFRGFGMRPLLRDVDSPLDLRMDVTEDDKNYLVSVDIPGVDKKDIEVSIDGNQVAINAEVKRVSKTEAGKQLHTERYHGTAFRSFTLPHDIDDAKATAKYESGVLHLTLPKKSGSKTHKIAIN